jgi:hypothetical protein
MTERDNFMLRWARLKRRADISREIDRSRNGSAIQPKGISEVTAEQPGIGGAGATDDPFDASGLPLIEMIDANTDVSGFLKSGVPTELMRAALRRTWTTDPAIRDFIGIAENQWDFNDPNAMAGFGPLGVTGNEPAVLTQILGESPGTPSKWMEAGHLTPSSVSRPTAVHDTVQHKVSELPLTGTNTSCLSNEELGMGASTESGAAVEDQDHFKDRRPHCSALPH